MYVLNVYSSVHYGVHREPTAVCVLQGDFHKTIIIDLWDRDDGTEWMTDVKPQGRYHIHHHYRNVTEERDAHSNSRRAPSFSITSTLKAAVKAGAQPQLAKVVLDTLSIRIHTTILRRLSILGFVGGRMETWAKGSDIHRTASLSESSRE